MTASGPSEQQRVEITRRALFERRDPATGAGAVERVAAGYGVPAADLARWVRQCELHLGMDSFSAGRRRRALYGGPVVIAFGLVGIPSAFLNLLHGDISAALAMLAFGLAWSGGFGALWYFVWRTDRFVKAVLSGLPAAPQPGGPGYSAPPTPARPPVYGHPGARPDRFSPPGPRPPY